MAAIRKSGLTLIFSLFIVLSYSQGSKFGDFSIAELTMKVYPQDTSAAAVFLFDKGQAKLSHGSTSPMNYKRHMRIKVLKKSGFDKWATQSIVVPRGSLSKLKAITANLEDNKIVVSEMDDNSVFKIRHSKHYDEVRFTLPNVKEGSVLDVSYVQDVDYYPSWSFQHSIPVMWSEMSIGVPTDVSYRKETRGVLTPTKYEKTPTIEHWIFQNVPAFEEEPLMPNPQDYISSIDFSGSKASWWSVNSMMMENADFGGAIKGNSALKLRVDELVRDMTDPRQKIMTISNYVKANITWDGTADVYADDFDKVFKKKSGTAADINLMLAAMLNKAGIPVQPVLVSTVGNGFTRPDLPTSYQFNYVIVQARIDTVGILLDATEKFLPWDVLPTRCLNGQGFLVSEDHFGWINVTSGVKAKTITSGDLVLNEDGGLQGKLSFSHEGYSAWQHRKDFNKMGEADYVKDVFTSNTAHVTSSEFANIENIEKPAREVHTIRMEENATIAGDLIYLNPIVAFREDENPFISDTRKFPIDFITPIERAYRFTIIIPDTYTVEELPATKIMSLPGNVARFTYSVTQMGNKLVIVSNIQINQRAFVADQYTNLRELYARIVAKQAEQIVLKKK